MRWILLLVAGLILNAPACRRSDELVVYTALDREFSEPILNRFEQGSGITVLPKYDVESTKTVGLTQAIIGEAKRPRCDVFWNNEILNTLRLKKLGLLETYATTSAEPFPETFKAADATWYGFAGRARVLLVNTDLLKEAQRPNSIRDLAAERFKGKAGIAKPLFGTTATHVACLFEVLGEREAKDFLLSLKANDVQVMSGNKQVAEAVSSGQLLFGVTDTDDAIVEVDKGHPVAIVYPDQEAGGLGALFIPNTVAIIRNGPNPAAARRFVDYVLSPEVEEMLAAGESAQIPLNPQVTVKPRVLNQKDVKAMQTDFEAAAEQWDIAMKFVEGDFLAP